MCSINTCDMYMCRLRHINDPVLSSLKMEGIRFLFISAVALFKWLSFLPQRRIRFCIPPAPTLFPACGTDMGTRAN
jgi:hypothetical protein